MGRAGTGVASACADGSSIFFNPAGITAADRQQLSVGGTLMRIAVKRGQEVRQGALLLSLVMRTEMACKIVVAAAVAMTASLSRLRRRGDTVVRD